MAGFVWPRETSPLAAPLARAEEIYQHQTAETARALDLLFVVVMATQWLAGIGLSLWLQSQGWTKVAGDGPGLLLVAVMAGSALSGLAVLMIALAAGTGLARVVVAVTQMLWSGLFLYLLEGRPEAHAHVFVSLAGLGLYRDPRLLLTALVVAVAVQFGSAFTFLVPPIESASPALSQAATASVWAILEVGILLAASRCQRLETMRLAERQANLEYLRAEADQLATERSTALREAHSQLQAMHDALPLGMFLTNAGGRTVRINPALERLMRFNPEESMVLSWVRLVHPDDFPEFDRRRRAAEAIGASYDSEHRFLFPDGRVIWVRLNAAPIKHENHLLGYVGTIEDISERRKQEAELVRAKEAAIAANEAKSMFLANMSHEIRTPMNAILGFVEVLSEREQTPENRDVLRIIQVNGEHLLELISDVLDLTKIESGRMEMELVEWPLARLVSDLVSMQAARAAQAGLTFEVEVVGPVPRWIPTDPVRLRQILLNLISNAIKFTETGGIRLVVEFVPSGPPTGFDYLERGPYVIFRVIDSGIGMTDEQCQRLFRPFCQADPTTTRRFGGTGLGLTICKRLVTMFRGDIRVRSQPKVGSEFIVVLPIGPVDDIPLDPTLDLLFDNEPGQTAAADDSDSVLDAPLPSDEPIHVLLVDDGEDNRRLLTYFLNTEGAQVTIACNGQEAVDLVAGGLPCTIILMDMQMPVMDGYTATRLLRARGVRLPIIALTANAMVGDREKCLEAGCDDYLTKPVSRADLSSMLDKHARMSASMHARSLSSVRIKNTHRDDSGGGHA